MSTTTLERKGKTAKPSPRAKGAKPTVKLSESIIEIVSDSGEGAQRCVQSLAQIAAKMGNGVWTVEIIPAEIELAPMLGLLGTVTGIIATFDMITVVGGGKPRLLAGGISEALITTATGLAIAIPGLLAHSFLSSRIEGLIADAERFAASLSNVLKQKRSDSPSGGGKTGGNH